jgi:hypothetical protein
MESVDVAVADCNHVVIRIYELEREDDGNDPKHSRQPQNNGSDDKKPFSCSTLESIDAILSQKLC